MSASYDVRLRRWWHKNDRSDKLVRAVPLVVEQLENRALPSVAANQAFLATLYQGELGRNIEAGGLTSWNNVLNQTASRTQVAGAILNSEEFFSRELVMDYNALLGRSPDPLGLQSFMEVLRNGGTARGVQAQIMGSDEFFARVGSDPVTFVNAVYGEVLNRTVDAAGLVAWTPLATTAAGRTAVAQAVETSPEAAQLMVITIYSDTLGRAPDAAGLSYWANQLEQGVSQTNVLAGVLGSDEFLGRLQAYLAQSNANDPNVAAAGFIAADRLFVSRPNIVAAFQPPVSSTPPDNSPNPPTGNVGDNSGFISGQDCGGSVVNPGVDTSGGGTDSTWSGNDGSGTNTSSDNTGCDNSGSDNSGDTGCGACGSDGCD